MPRFVREALLWVAVLLAAIALHGPAAADEPPLPGEGQTPVYGSALPRFALFGWVCPPRDSTTVGRYQEVADAGFNVTLPVLDETGTWVDNAARLAVTRELGLKNILLDNDLDSVFVEVPESLDLADEIVTRYQADPAFLGYYLGDEPNAADFPRLGEWFSILRERDPAHPAWNSLKPRWAFADNAAFLDYLRQYAAWTRPAVLCNNQYDFLIWGDMRMLTENVSTVALVARENGIPFWGIVQLVEHWKYRKVTPGMLRWQVAQWLAWGARGIGYFTYWTPPPMPGANWKPAMIEWGTGQQTDYYHLVANLDRRLVPLGNALAGMGWIKTQHAGSVPRYGVPFTPDSVLYAVEGRATLGMFGDSSNSVILFVANADSAQTRTITLTLARECQAWQLAGDGSTWDPLPVDGAGRVALALDAGDFVLLRIPVPARLAGVAPRPAGAALQLGIAPNPASGRVHFRVSGVSGPARLEVIDLAGRVVWSHAVDRGVDEVAWNGEGAASGRVASGVYFARLREGGASIVRRVAWLGPR